jgi:hypothetical protein
MAGLAGAAAAAALIATPVGLLETIVASSGLSEALPAAAPPRGLTARLSMAGFAGLLAVGLVSILRRDSARENEEIEDEGRDDRAQGARKMGFAFSKLTALARGRATPLIETEAPVLRRADAHPDAPPRPPIFASRDFDGVEIFARREAGRRPLVVHSEPEPESVRPAPGFAAPPAPGEQEVQPQPAFLRPAIAESVAESAPESADAPVDEARTYFDAPEDAGEDAEPFAPETPRPLPLPTHGLSIAQLTDRLERGLASRRRSLSGRSTGVLADMPVAARVPVRESVAPDADEALRAALGALRAMTARPR